MTFADLVRARLIVHPGDEILTSHVRGAEKLFVGATRLPVHPESRPRRCASTPPPVPSPWPSRSPRRSGPGSGCSTPVSPAAWPRAPAASAGPGSPSSPRRRSLPRLGPLLQCLEHPEQLRGRLAHHRGPFGVAHPVDGVRQDPRQRDQARRLTPAGRSRRSPARRPGPTRSSAECNGGLRGIFHPPDGHPYHRRQVSARTPRHPGRDFFWKRRSLRAGLRVDICAIDDDKSLRHDAMCICAGQNRVFAACCYRMRGRLVCAVTVVHPVRVLVAWHDPGPAQSTCALSRLWSAALPPAGTMWSTSRRPDRPHGPACRAHPRHSQRRPDRLSAATRVRFHSGSS